MTELRKEIEGYFTLKNIEYFAFLDYSDLYRINDELLVRDGITPRSVIIYLLPYYAGECENLSRYAAARDYHLCIREINSELCDLIARLRPNTAAKGYGDHSPIAERHAALIGGLGILGDNGLLINEKYGSYIFVADVITDIPPSELDVTPPFEIKRCEGCGLCKKSCPTGILRGEGEDCLSAITQRKGELAEWERALMRKHNTAWGCDLCQSSCPHNRKPQLTPIVFFREERITRLTRELLDGMNKEDFKSRAFSWRGRKTVERNLDILES